MPDFGPIHNSLLLLNLVTFGVFGWDKFQAIRNGWRVPEKTLLSLALAGGSIGAYLAMRLFRHKTSKLSFRRSFYAILAIQILILGYWLYR